MRGPCARSRSRSVRRPPAAGCLGSRGRDCQTARRRAACLHLNAMSFMQPRTLRSGVLASRTGKNRVHLDLVVDDLDQSTAEIEKLGGRWLEPGNTRELEGFRWRCMADPEGNEFDIDVLPGA